MTSREDTWTVAVRVPMRLSHEMKDSLFTAVADAVHDWEPDDRDGWDADVTGCPTKRDPLPEWERELLDRQMRQAEIVRLVSELESWYRDRHPDWPNPRIIADLRAAVDRGTS